MTVAVTMTMTMTMTTLASNVESERDNEARHAEHDEYNARCRDYDHRVEQI